MTGHHPKGDAPESVPPDFPMPPAATVTGVQPATPLGSPAGDSFEDMLADPSEQFDLRSELLASISAYAAAPPASAGIQPGEPDRPFPARVTGPTSVWLSPPQPATPLGPPPATAPMAPAQAAFEAFHAVGNEAGHGTGRQWAEAGSLPKAAFGAAAEAAITAGTGRLLAEAARYKRERDEARAELAESNRLRAQSYDRLLDSGKQLADLDAAYKTLTAQCEVHHLARQSAESRLETAAGERDALLLDVAARQRDLMLFAETIAGVRSVIRKYQAEELSALDSLGEIEEIFADEEDDAEPSLSGCAEPHGPDRRCFDCATDDELAASIPPFPGTTEPQS